MVIFNELQTLLII